MLHEIAKELDTALRAKGVPLRVVSGPERTQPVVMARERIVLERDRDSGDSFGPVTSQRTNPKARMSQSIGCVLKIFAQATASGATVQEHERRAMTVLDRVLVALDTIIRGARQNFWEQASGRFTTPDDLEESGTWSGAVYELKFSIARSVLDRTWPTTASPQGEARPEATFGGDDGVGVTNEIVVHVNGGEEETFPFGAEA